MNKPVSEQFTRDRQLIPGETAVLVVDAQMSEFNDAKRAAENIVGRLQLHQH